MADDFAEENSFFESTSPPLHYDASRHRISEFCDQHKQLGRKIVLVTSGGTTVPLEHNTVRFVDNFSAGTRGSSSAEYFLDKGYAVVFLFRTKSMEPFSRHFAGDTSFLDMLDVRTAADGSERVEVGSQSLSYVLPILKKYQAMHSENRLLGIQFTTLADYLWLLRCCSEALAPFGRNAMLYLAAAVADFYLPNNEMSTHKIHSDSPLTISLKLVPKMLRPLVRQWVPDAYVISFKLETDSSILTKKAREALSKYGHQMVIANMLQTRKRRVTLVTEDTTFPLEIRPDEEDRVEIEEKIIDLVVECHQKFAVASS